MGNILDEARKDAKEILLNGGFETDIKFTKSGSEDINTKGLAIRRTDTLEFDDGGKKHSPFSSITVPFDAFSFTDTYISLKGWAAEFQDSEKTLTYDIVESLPNRTLGIINCTLKDKDE